MSDGGDGSDAPDDETAGGAADPPDGREPADDPDVRDPAAVADDLDQPVILFDGVCNLCNGFVRFVVRFDTAGTFLFAPLQSPVGRELLERLGLERPDDATECEPTSERESTTERGGSADAGAFDTMVLVEPDGEYATKSTAALRIARRLDGPWPLCWPLAYLPRRLRDGVYDLVARHRYRIFGRTESCPVPEPELRERFAARSLA